MRRIHAIIPLLVIILAAFALRVFRLDFQSLWYDEAFSVYLAQFALGDITARTAADIQPPLYYYLLHFWISIAGDSEFAVRFFSLFFGVLTIPLMYVTARRLFDRSAAVIVGVLATLSPLYLWYSQEARMYTLITFLLLLSSYALSRALSPSPVGDGGGPGWGLFTLANIAAVYTHYFAFAVIAFQFLHALLTVVARSKLRIPQGRFAVTNYELRIAICFAAILLAFLPWTPFVIARFGQDASYWQGALKLDEAVRHIFINFTTGESVLEQQAQWIFAVFVSFAAFVFLGFTSAYADSNAYFDPAFSKASFRDVARYVDEHLAPGEAIILTSGHLFPAFNYYYRGEAPQIRLPDDPTLNAEHVIGYDAANVMNQTLAGAPGVWVVQWQDEVVDPNGFVSMLLSSRGKEQKIEGTSFYQVRLRHWTLAPDARFEPAPQPGIARPANFKDRVALLGFDTPNPTPSDQGASFNLYWQARETLGDDYQVALRVLDAAGSLWGKQDRRPAGYNYPTTRWKKGENLFGAYTVPLVAGAPAGDYFVQVTFYTASNPSGLDVLAPNGAPVGKSVKVGPIPVLPATKPATYAALNIQNTISQPLGPFTLLGYQFGRDKASAGETIPLTLFWRADAKPDTDYSFRLQFGDFVGEPFPISNLQFPTSTWRSGEIVRGQYAVPIPAEAKAGAVNLQVALSDGNSLALAPFTIEKTDRVFVKPTVQFAQTAIFGDNYLALVGYSVSAAVRPGENLKLDLAWQARGKMDKPYTVFVHLLDKDGKVVAQKDAQPQNGARPTTGWVANEYLTDHYELPIPASAAPGNYQIEIGWYDAKDPAFARLQVLGEDGVAGADHVILKTAVTIGQ
ncbi:MAG: glycosyltransferase family 39 protein [Chloroflexi bacterium]|nr:glycosyltransferase family 39 protein [Chloroflexota bacterium]